MTSIASLRREVAKIREELRVDQDVGLIPTIDLNDFSPEERRAYLDADSWDEQKAIVEQVTGEPFVTHRNRRPDGKPPITCVEIGVADEDAVG